MITLIEHSRELRSPDRDVPERSVAQADQGLLADLGGVVSRETILRGREPLAKRTTLRVGGPAQFYAEPASDDDLSKIVSFCKSRLVPIFLLGRGSNLLIRDGGIRGMVICLNRPHFVRIEAHGEHLVCGAGAKLKAVAIDARRSGIAGLEFFEGIPGSVGGALRMNAGAMGASTFDVVDSLRYMDFDGEVHECSNADAKAQYRECAMLKQNIALSAKFAGKSDTREAIDARMMTFSRKRWDSQPAAPSAGCIFKNPLTIPAGKLVDELGLKGTRVGAACVSQEHGNFIVNEGGARARDVLELIAIIKSKVKAGRAIDLHTEVEIVGEDA